MGLLIKLESDRRNKLFRYCDVIPFVIVFLSYFLCIIFSGMMYMTNDDSSIQQVLSGATTGSPFPYHQFISFLIGYPVSWLYSLFPSIQWWFVFEHFLLATGMLIVNELIWRTAKEHLFPLLPAILLISFVDIVYYLYSISYIGFTVVSGIVGSAAVSLLMHPSKKHRLTNRIWSMLLFAVCICIRAQSGRVIACFMLLILCDLVIRREENNDNLKQLFLFGIVASLLVIGLPKINSAVQRKVNGEEFVEFNSARSAYKDYPHDSYQDNPLIFQDVGWTETTYNLVEKWCFMDDHVTAESFRYLVENSKAERESASLDTMISRWNNVVQSADIQPIIFTWLIYSGFTLVCVLLCWDKRQLLLYLLNTLGAFAFASYLLYIGRPLYRALLICILPSIIIDTVIVIRQTDKCRTKYRYTSLLFIPFFTLSILYSSKVVIYAFEPGRRIYYEEQAKKDEELVLYFIEHPENLYVKAIGTTSNSTPYLSENTRKGINYIGWGGATFGSKANVMRLEAAGLSTLEGSVMKKKNTFFVSATNIEDLVGQPTYPLLDLSNFYIWQRDEYGAIGLQKVDSVCDGTVFIYRFLFDENDVSQSDYVYEYEDGCFRVKSFIQHRLPL